MAAPIGNTPLAGYPQAHGNKNAWVGDHTGPASYTQFTSPTTGGDVLNAADIGQGGFDVVQAGVDTTGQIRATVINYLGGYGNAVPKVIISYGALVTATLGGQAQTAGAQIAAATNLSTFSFRLKVLAV